ncbi:MAG TPA: hypothetical protein VH561_16150 [Micromonosporaceae bacterium]
MQGGWLGRSAVRFAVVGVAVLAALVTSIVVIKTAGRPHVPVASLHEPSSPTPDATPTPEVPALDALPLHPENKVAGTTPWWSWALVDRRTGESWGSANDEEGSRTASMVKAWLAALYLRLHPNPSQSWLSTLSTMIRDSNNDAADATHEALGGNSPVTSAMKSICGVSAFVPSGHWWASTTISARQQALLGTCIAAGKVDAPKWTQWVLNEMRHVRGGGNFGIRLAFPKAEQSSIAIKNGWSDGWGNGWYVNCMAIGDTWVLVVETRSGSFGAGTNGCLAITKQLMKTPASSG